MRRTAVVSAQEVRTQTPATPAKAQPKQQKEQKDVLDEINEKPNNAKAYIKREGK